MKLNVHFRFRAVLLASVFLIGIGLTVLFDWPVFAQVSRLTPRIETIKGNDPTVPSSFRLVISQPQDIVFVNCPRNYAPKLGYLRNVEAIQCERFQSK